MRICKEQLCRHQVSAEVGAGGAPGSGAGIALQPVMKTMVRQLPLKPMGGHVGAEIHLEPVEEPHAGAGNPAVGCDPGGSLC